jgi:prephenate dehydrogenase
MRSRLRSRADVADVAVPAATVTKAAPRIAKLVVIGVGLIGGSFALALKAAARVERVVGVGRGRANLDVARSRGIIDDGRHARCRLDR